MDALVGDCFVNDKLVRIVGLIRGGDCNYWIIFKAFVAFGDHAVSCSNKLNFFSTCLLNLGISDWRRMIIQQEYSRLNQIFLINGSIPNYQKYS